jgi:hypothetical protein
MAPYRWLSKWAVPPRAFFFFFAFSFFLSIEKQGYKKENGTHGADRG